MSSLFEQFAATKPRKKFNTTAAFIFDWDVDERDGEMVGIIKDVRLRDHKGKEIPHSSLVMEDIGAAGWYSFFDATDFKVSGRYRWEGSYFAHRDYWGEWDCGWDVISLEPADRKTRKALMDYSNEQTTERMA